MTCQSQMMSIKQFVCICFRIFVLCNQIPYISQSTTQPQSPKQESTTESDDTSWFPEALQDIAYYLRGHKFNEYDRRYELDVKLARREYYKGFPRPPLRSLHWEVHKYCEPSLLECARYLRKRIGNSGMRRVDDTAVVIHQQQWDLNNNSKQIEIVDKDCRKMKELDDIQANPFEGPIERFQWRVTASYYMCWYTMKSDPALAHISDKCDNFASCLDPDFGPNNGDDRANDSVPFGCALYSFCPDPCCPMKHLTRPENCWNKPDNPCFGVNPAGQRECVVNRSENTDFTDIILNRWNVSCSCPRKGFEWSSFYGICIDVDECASGTHTCDLENEVCLNLPGGFRCACKWGHTFNSKTGKCEASDALAHLVLQYQQNETSATNESIWNKFVIWFTSSKASTVKSSQGTNLVAALSSLVSLLRHR